MDEDLMDVVQGYIAQTFSEQMQAEIQNSFALFDAFEHRQAYVHLPDIVLDIDADNTDLTQLKFLSSVNEQLDVIFKAHQIELEEDTELYVKNQILSVLYRLQMLEDIIPVLRILESSFSDEEKIAKIVEEYSELDEATVLVALKSVQSSTLETLQSFLYTQEEQQEKKPEIDPEVFKQIQNTLKDFFVICGQDNLAFEFIQSGMSIGYPVKLYYPYVKEYLITDNDTQSAKNLLSLFLMAQDTYHDPLQVYRIYSEALVLDLEQRMRIETQMGALLNELRHYQEAQDVAKRVSST